MNEAEHRNKIRLGVIPSSSPEEAVRLAIEADRPES